MKKFFHSSKGEGQAHTYISPLEKKVKSVISSLQDFIDIQLVASVLLVICTMLALVWASTDSIEHMYQQFVNLKLGVIAHVLVFTRPLYFWVNEVLLTLFFFWVGLEIKREFLVGELVSIKSATLVVIAALGGMMFPSIIYALFNMNTVAQHGWAIPMATDTAFALGIATCFKNRLPSGVVTFIAALAIIDDIGAILVIAVFYTQSVDVTMLLVTCGILVLLILMNYMGFRSPYPYLFLGFFMWATTEASGIHGTIAGILAALCVPARPQEGPNHFIRRMEKLLKKFKQRKEQTPLILKDYQQHVVLEDVQKIAKEATTPLQRWENKLELPIVIVILPLFALVNAGIPIHLHLIDEIFSHKTSLGIMLGLIIGKPFGISFFTWLTLKLRLGALPSSTSMRHIIAVSFLTGIGFTMSLFISNVSFANAQLTLVSKGGILFGSIISALLSIIFIRLLKPIKHGIAS